MNAKELLEDRAAADLECQRLRERLGSHGPCQISGGPCERPHDPTALYAGVIGPIALCDYHAGIVQATPIDRARLNAQLAETDAAVDRLRWLLAKLLDYASGTPEYIQACRDARAELEEGDRNGDPC